jgi:hypothetical protein
VRSKRFLRLWYVWCKLWIYLAPTLTLSSNRPKRDSTSPTSPRSFIRCVQNDFWGYGTFGANYAPILSQDYHYFQTDQNEILHDPRHLGFHRVHPKWFPSSRYVWRKPCIYLESRFAQSRYEPKRVSIWASSCRSTTGVSKMISEPMVQLAQIVQLSCSETNTISKWIKMIFYMRLTLFLKLWYVWCKLFIYLALRLTLSLNGPNRDSKWPTSPRSSIGCD